MARCDNCLANKVCDHHRFGFENCGSYISAADVAPKSEVAREIIDKFMSAMRVKHEENRPKYGGALALLLPDIEQIAAELKKKYTEGKG